MGSPEAELEMPDAAGAQGMKTPSTAPPASARPWLWLPLLWPELRTLSDPRWAEGRALRRTRGAEGHVHTAGGLVGTGRWCGQCHAGHLGGHRRPVFTEAPNANPPPGPGPNQGQAQRGHASLTPSGDREVSIEEAGSEPSSSRQTCSRRRPHSFLRPRLSRGVLAAAHSPEPPGQGQGQAGVGTWHRARWAGSPPSPAGTWREELHLGGGAPGRGGLPSQPRQVPPTGCSPQRGPWGSSLRHPSPCRRSQPCRAPAWPGSQQLWRLALWDRKDTLCPHVPRPTCALRPGSERKRRPCMPGTAPQGIPLPI